MYLFSFSVYISDNSQPTQGIPIVENEYHQMQNVAMTNYRSELESPTHDNDDHQEISEVKKYYRLIIILYILVDETIPTSL